MHSRDPNKSDAEFQSEIERILREAGEGEADFTQFVFRKVAYGNKQIFDAKCIFNEAKFLVDASFSDATFMQGANFSEAIFEQKADFRYAAFKGDANFSSSTFIQCARFRNAKFPEDADFSGATFMQDVDFDFVQFAQAYFRDATFVQLASFSHATFAKETDFSDAKVARSYFRAAKFSEAARFIRTKFMPDSLDGVRLSQASRFLSTKLDLRASNGSLVKDVPGNIDGTNQTQPKRGSTDEDPSSCHDFAYATFEKPEQVKFYKTSLQHALFHSCDVSSVEFSDVKWRQGKNGRCMVFEEEVTLSRADALKPSKGDRNERNYRLIAELYQQLTKNYDDRRDYWTAGHFHFGELEMKRLHSPRRLNLFRWWHRHLGLAAWYKYISAYGESYVRPAMLLAGTLVIFSLLYPVAGLRHDIARDRAFISNGAGQSTIVRLTYSSPLEGSGDRRPLWKARLGLVGCSAITTVGISLFLRDLSYEPLDPWGSTMKVAEVVLTSTFAALFLLALRRKFKR